MEFERYVPTVKRGFKPKVSIWQRGQIGFNKKAVEKLNVKDYKYVVLFFNRETRTIGIKLTNDEDAPGIHKINHGQSGAFVSAAGFVEDYKIPHEKTRKYDVSYWQDEDMWLVPLEQQKG